MNNINGKLILTAKRRNGEEKKQSKFKFTWTSFCKSNFRTSWKRNKRFWKRLRFFLAFSWLISKALQCFYVDFAFSRPLSQSTFSSGELLCFFEKNEPRTSLDKLSHLLFWFLYFYIQLKAETKIFESGHRVKLICWINAKKCSWRIKVWITWTWRDEGQKLYSPRYLNHDQQNASPNEQTELKNALKCAFE